MPRPLARVRSTASVCGWQAASAKKRAFFPRAWPWHIAMASAAAVASSSRDALATGSPVRSAIRVWKFSSPSRRPWAISAW